VYFRFLSTYICLLLRPNPTFGTTKCEGRRSTIRATIAMELKHKPVTARSWFSTHVSCTGSRRSAKIPHCCASTLDWWFSNWKCTKVFV